MKAFKSIFGILIFAATLPLITSCESNEVDGKWKDAIKLSTNKASFGSAADSVVITSKGTWWWFTEIRTNSNIYYPIREEGGNDNPSSWYVKDRSDTLTYKIPSIHKDDEYTINDDFFDIKKIGLNRLIIKLNANETSADRYVMIDLEAGDYFETVTILQSGKK